MGNGKHTGTPAANAASRRKGNTPGSQRGGRVDQKAIRREWSGKPREGYLRPVYIYRVDSPLGIGANFRAEIVLRLTMRSAEFSPAESLSKVSRCTTRVVVFSSKVSQ